MSETSTSGSANAVETPGEEELFYTLWTVFKRSGADIADSAVADFESAVARLGDAGVTLRGAYDVSAMREDADVMIWLHGSKPDELQAAVRTIRRTALFEEADIVWSAMGVHRDAEFTKNHSPSFALGKEPEAWLCVYPFVRSYEWYLLPAEERGKMLRDHGMLGRDFPQVLANTVASFALGDWEWILGLEAPELIDLVDLMRHLRYTDARNHVREEIPFYTGRRISPAEIAEVLR
ncbi:hydrogen peroxide-dependent heme synthase [Crystallibacter degradans]|uniref:hydrogen peroxide-dependent heme synthase n=1 Tax=Crystallibacter degradans TaxID=2726743 RepID=UPI001475E067|nr:hydrogen peroxide-dependent heme synthase [Arthrobacter sp. SF27]NMR29857.1 chlorite dismutase family protein [Arthrobacter sp. SF27]